MMMLLVSGNEIGQPHAIEVCREFSLTRPHVVTCILNKVSLNIAVALQASM